MFQSIETVAKIAINFTVTAGASKIVRDVIQNNITEPETAYESIQYTAGAFALGGLVAAETSKYTNVKVEETVAFFRSLKKNKNTEETTTES